MPYCLLEYANDEAHVYCIWDSKKACCVLWFNQSILCPVVPMFTAILPPLAMELPLHFSLLHSKALSNKADGNDLPWRFRDIGV